MMGSFHGPGGSFGIGIELEDLDFFKIFTTMKRKRRQAKSRGMDGNWKSILKEGEREEGVVRVVADMQFIAVYLLVVQIVRSGVYYIIFLLFLK